MRKSLLLLRPVFCLFFLSSCFSAELAVAAASIKFMCVGQQYSNCRSATERDVDEIAEIFINAADTFVDPRLPENDSRRTNLREQLIIPPKVVTPEGASLAIAKWWVTQKLGGLWVATRVVEGRERIISIMEMKLMDSFQLAEKFADEVRKYNKGRLVWVNDLYSLDLPPSIKFISYQYASGVDPSSRLALAQGLNAIADPTNLFTARTGWLQFLIYAGSVYGVSIPRIKDAFTALRDYAWKEMVARIKKREQEVLEEVPMTPVSVSFIMGQVSKNFKDGTKPSLESFRRTMAEIGLPIAQVQAFETLMPILKREYAASVDEFIDGKLPLEIGAPGESSKHIDSWTYAVYFVMEAFKVSRL